MRPQSAYHGGIGTSEGRSVLTALLFAAVIPVLCFVMGYGVYVGTIRGSWSGLTVAFVKLALLFYGVYFFPQSSSWFVG